MYHRIGDIDYMTHFPICYLVRHNAPSVVPCRVSQSPTKPPATLDFPVGLPCTCFLSFPQILPMCFVVLCDTPLEACQKPFHSPMKPLANILLPSTLTFTHPLCTIATVLRRRFEQDRIKKRRVQERHIDIRTKVHVIVRTLRRLRWRQRWSL